MFIYRASELFEAFLFYDDILLLVYMDVSKALPTSAILGTQLL
jgi:hypothetical protein